MGKANFGTRAPETPKPIVTKFDTRDYVLGPYNRTKFERDPYGVSSPHRATYVRMFTTLLCFLVLPIAYRQDASTHFYAKYVK